MKAASKAFEAWVANSVAPVARASGFRGTGPVFRKRDESTWVVFAVERRRVDPPETTARSNDPTVDFRLVVGAALSATLAAWDDTPRRPVGVADLTIHAPSLALEPPDGESWHEFDARDPEGQARLTALIEVGLVEALAALGRADARSILDLQLAFAGPLEDLAPGHAEYLLALADEAGDAELRTRIVDALKRERPPDGRDEERRRLIEEAAEIFGPGVGVDVLMPPRDDEIFPPFRPTRRHRATKAKLLAALASDRKYPRRQAADRLGGWDGDVEVVVALRAALSNPDEFTRLKAARSLGQVSDADLGTWTSVLALADGAASGPSELADAIVLLARLDPPDRSPTAVETLERMVDRYPAWTRLLRGRASLLRTPT